MIANATAEVGITEIFAAWCVGNSNAECVLADSIFKATYIVLALTCAVSGNEDALIISTYVVVGLCVATPEDRIAFVLLITRENNAGGVVIRTFGVFSTGNHHGTFIGTRSVDGDALVCSITFHVLLATPEEGIAAISTRNRQRNARREIFRTFSMLSAINC